MPTKSIHYVATFKGQPPVDLQLEPLGPGRYALTLDGQRHELDVVALANGGLSFLTGGESHEALVDTLKSGELQVLIDGHQTRLDIADERTLRSRAASSAFSVEGKQEICAPMPGKVVRVLVKPGDVVTEGQGLVVVEAMKMENELKSPKAGTVLSVHTTEGVAVENGAKLVVVE